jgi:hypothetical protein
MPTTRPPQKSLQDLMTGCEVVTDGGEQPVIRLISNPVIKKEEEEEKPTRRVGTGMSAALAGALATAKAATGVLTTSDQGDQ